MSRFAYIVDDDESVRSSLRALLSVLPNLHVRVYPSGDAFLADAPTCEPGVILLDIHMPGRSGLDVLRALKSDTPGFAAIILTGQGDIGLAVQAMKLGAIEFLEKPYDHLALFAALEEAFARLENSRSRTSRTEMARARIAALSEREREILRALISGSYNKSIAHELSISVRTVEVHRANLMAKLKVGSLTEVLRIAFMAGMMDEEASFPADHG